MTPDPITEIPPEVIQSAHVVERYFAERGSTRWALAGVCSRNFESEVFALRMELVKLHQSIWNAMRQEYSATTPGEYLCACRVCGTHYMGDKLSYACAECAYDPKPAKEEE